MIECAGHTGFIEKAIGQKAGRMRFHLIWEGYPYVGEQYLIPDGPIVQAELSYDGEFEGKEHRFALSFGDQVIFYFVGPKGKMSRKLWVAQGLTLLKKD